MIGYNETSIIQADRGSLVFPDFDCSIVKVEFKAFLVFSTYYPDRKNVLKRVKKKKMYPSW